MIFYLSQTDEQNGYGTVIQLDEHHQASIYPDLNPEYTYLFYKDEQGQLQTLLWCIEFATRTEDGLYITQAKIHGRGVTEEDMQRFNQIMISPTQPAAPAHNLAETYTPTPTTAPASSIPNPSPSTPAAPQPAVSQPEASPAVPNFMGTDTALPPTPPQPAMSQPIEPQALEPAPVQPAMPMPSEPVPATLSTPPQPTPITPEATNVTQNIPAPSNTAPITFPSLPDLGLPSQPASEQPMPEFDLPPLPDLAAPAQAQPDAPLSQSSPFSAGQPVAPAQTIPPVVPNSAPAMPQPSPSAAQSKNPVGRPPKPLLSEATWAVDQADFSWAKAISREPIAANRDQLRQKLNNQIQRNQPELFNNPNFASALDQAFAAICQAYDLAPTARQDLLKSLLNGRIVENLAKTLN
jgi:hypothetical protein